MLSIAVMPIEGVQAEFVQGEFDHLAADTIDLVVSVAPDAGSGLLNVQLDLYIFNDGNNILGVNVGYYWDHPDLFMDSAVLTPLAEVAFDFYAFCYYRTVLDTTNVHQKFVFSTGSMTWPCLAPHNERQLIASYYFTLNEWSESDSIVIDTMYWNTASEFIFGSSGAEGYHNYLPVWNGPKVIYDTPASCCVLRVGDANGVDGDEPTLGDISVMIDAKFISGYCDGIIACLGEADVNLSGGADPTCDDITLGDISILQDYLFITGPSLGLDDCY